MNDELFPDFLGGYAFAVIVCGISVMLLHYALGFEPWKIGLGFVGSSLVVVWVGSHEGRE